MSSSSQNQQESASKEVEDEAGGVSPLTEITTAALARVGISDDEAAAILSDKSLMDDLREAQRRIAEAGEMARDAESTLVDALISEGLNLDDDDIKKMLRDINCGAEEDGEDDHEECHKKTSTKKQEGNNMNDGDDTECDDQEEFGNLIESLLKMSLAKNKNSEGAAVVAVTEQKKDSLLLPVLPLIAEFCGALPSLYSLTLVCQTWRGLLLSESRAIQRTLWIAIACNEFPVEVSELGEDAFVDVVCWSDIVNKFVKDQARKTVRGSLTE